VSIKTDIQLPAPGDKVELYILDATVLGGSVHRMCSSIKDGQSIVWQGNIYSPMPIKAGGFEVVGGGKLPTPTLQLVDGYGLFRAMIRQYNDLVGAKFTRYVTFRKYLDNEPEADPLAYYPPDIYWIDRKTKQIGAELEWQLAALMDQQGKMLPGRTVLREPCNYIYRIWDAQTVSFDYTVATCPYEDPVYFNANGESCSAADDVCGQRLSDCVLRYGKQPLPYQAFPGVSDVRN
jgi:lambda family phage minor tail protein L